LKEAITIVNKSFAIDIDRSVSNNTELQTINRTLLEKPVQNRQLSNKLDSLESEKLMSEDNISELESSIP
jgi:hypothetical protein